MSPAAFRLVVLVSLAHALVHIFELALPGVEQEIAAEFGVGKEVSGWLSFAWRLPWGFCAIGAGWLTDRWGGERTLTLYLFGCAALCALAGCNIGLPMLFVVMAAMGTVASIYHPAGLALISHRTLPHDRPRALGIHGVFGSLGIGGAPLLAALVLGFGYSWRSYYWLLSLLAALVGTFFFTRTRQANNEQVRPADERPQPPEDAEADWTSFGLICIHSLFQGFSYAAMMSFLPRYLGQSDLRLSLDSGAAMGSFLAGSVLLAGCLGQYVSGRIARPSIMEKQLSVISLLSAGPLAWMAVAVDSQRVVAAALYALVMFMLQPIYNSLVAKYTPAHRRSLCYGLTFAIGLGLGSLGSIFLGYCESDLAAYGTLSGLAICQALVGWGLWRRHRA